MRGDTLRPIRRERLVGIDILKIYAIIMVVLTHCYLPQFVQARYAELWIYNAVPFFLIIGAYFYSRKYCELANECDTFSKICKFWYGKQSLLGYFKRICIPYFIFMLAQVIVLPVVGYASVDVVLLNTIKGGMGAGGYYLAVYLQLFILAPIINRFYDKNPCATGLVCVGVQFVYSAAIEYLSSVVENASLLTDINKFICVRFLIYFYLGTLLYRKLDDICSWHIGVVLGMSVVLKMLDGAFAYVGGGLYLLYSPMQGALWCFGLVCAVVYIARGIYVNSRVLSFVSGSTLHILLFQQLYFCCVGVGRHKAYIDAPIALFGGIATYALFVYVRKIVVRANTILLKRKKN